MTRSKPILVGLLIAATVVANVVACRLPAWHDSLRFTILGLALGQILMASASVVFLYRMIWLRLLLQITAIVVSAAVIDVVFSKTVLSATLLLPLLTAALVATSWCAGLRLFGWRMAEPSSESPVGQFSLATVMLVTTVGAGYFGLMRASLLSQWVEFDVVWFCGLMVMPGCLMLTATGRHALARLSPILFISLFYFVLSLAQGGALPTAITASAFVVLNTELVFVTFTLIVLRIAGVHLESPARRTVTRDNLVASNELASVER